MQPKEILFSAHSVAVVAVTAIAVLLCVLLHYESFTLFQRVLSRLNIRVKRRRILFLMYGLLTLHVAEVWLFGLGYYVLVGGALGGSGDSRLAGWQGGGLLEFVYFSAVVYTTLGLGDLVPHGAIRFMTGTEALSGFLLITWSASFTFLEMERLWKQ
jgi:hypothetical protein